MKNHELLEKYEGMWPSNVGGWSPGHGVMYRQRALFSDVSDMGWLGMLLYGMTGREFSGKQISLIEKIMIIASSFPDPRLWNNRIAALAGTVRSTHTLGISAANSMSETRYFGHRPNIKVIDFLFRADQWREQSGDLREFVLSELEKKQRIPGYGHPLVKHDERITPLLEAAGRLNCADGKFTRLVFEVEDITTEVRDDMRPNVAALAAGLLADQGVTAREFYQISWLSFLGGMFPCYKDTFDSPEGAFFPFSCNGLRYRGKAKRTWPIGGLS